MRVAARWLRSLLSVRANGGRNPSTLPNYIILMAITAVVIGPLFVMFFNSLKTDGEYRLDPLGVPSKLRWQNYRDAWELGGFGATMRNSLIITGGTIAGVVVICGLAAYSLARLNPVGGDAITFYLLVGTTLPSELFLVPLFFLWSRLGLTNSLYGLIILYWGMMTPFPTFLLRSYMIGVPKDFEEAALIDGATRWQALWYIFIPLCWPGFLVVILLTFMFAYNEFLYALVMIQKPNLRPISTSLYAFSTSYTTQWGLTNAAAVIMSIPILLIFLVLQRQFIQGLTQGGLK